MQTNSWKSKQNWGEDKKNAEKKLKEKDNDQENMEINQPMRLDCEASWC